MREYDATTSASRIRVRTTIAAPPRKVWSHLADVRSHVEWMSDAEEIRVTSRRDLGVGTTFECRTRLGPWRVTDVMEVIEWDEPTSLAVRHTGVVAGTGRFRLRRRRLRGTRLTWEERLSFPWWLGGRLGAAIASMAMRRVWRRNLAELKRRVEDA